MISKIIMRELTWMFQNRSRAAASYIYKELCDKEYFSQQVLSDKVIRRKTLAECIKELEIEVSYLNK